MFKIKRVETPLPSKDIIGLYSELSTQEEKCKITDKRKFELHAINRAKYEKILTTWFIANEYVYTKDSIYALSNLIFQVLGILKQPEIEICLVISNYYNDIELDIVIDLLKNVCRISQLDSYKLNLETSIIEPHLVNFLCEQFKEHKISSFNIIIDKDQMYNLNKLSRSTKTLLSLLDAAENEGVSRNLLLAEMPKDFKPNEEVQKLQNYSKVPAIQFKQEKSKSVEVNSDIVIVHPAVVKKSEPPTQSQIKKQTATGFYFFDKAKGQRAEVKQVDKVTKKSKHHKKAASKTTSSQVKLAR